MNKHLKPWVWSLLGIGFVSLGMQIASADSAPVTFYFQGTIDHIDPRLSNAVESSDVLRASFTFESATPDLFPPEVILFPRDAAYGRYALSRMTYSMGSLKYSATAAPGMSNAITLMNQSDPGFDRYDVGLLANISGPIVDNLAHTDFTLLLEKVGLFTDDSLPVSPPSLAAAKQRVWHARFAPDFHYLSGRLTSLSLTPVPLPGAIILFSTGLGVLLSSEGRKKRRRN